MSALQRGLMSKGLPPKGMTGSTVEKKLPPGKSFAPLPWEDFFDSRTTVNVEGDQFNVYLKGSSGPVFYFLHGGGYSGLTWACLTNDLIARIDCRCVAPDLRGHGLSTCSDEDDLSMEKQIGDIASILSSLFPSSSGDEPVPVIVVGHSMGGALAAHAVAHTLGQVSGVTIAGLVIIDVVEGSAMDALSGMTTYLRSRPAHFDNEEAAIKWCLSSGTVRNSKAARVSMPTQVRQREDGQYHWRINLLRSERHWVGWFKGLSSTFLSSAPPKMLVLAGTDRLDKELMIGQMQGKFQTTLLPRVGHAVQEDSPDRLADELARFAVRYRLATAKGGIQFHSPMC
ncbi:hypothetical protein PFISCL1PPCAC_11387 [Pristionchus fissidentatus]|uniref:Protein phosphatase methylesterase 1 n=1 Tax=Pristionchus fissidentatus TaxID=1538716 RepID=A0AAV5VKB5_9BILA|nr:hypothetical protein PFISCL1PPCAC_11387 [Pristionchus fissidentatus]